jgi:STIP1 family protein 1
MSSPSSPSDKHKLQGNSLFKDFRFEEAIKEYTCAIIQNPSNPVLYTNRAVAYSKLNPAQHEKSLIDAEKAISLNSESVKGQFLVGQALLNLNIRLNEASSHLKKAYEYGLSQRVSYLEEILIASRFCT